MDNFFKGATLVLAHKKLTLIPKASISLIVWLVLSRNHVIGGKIDPSAATVRTTVTCLFSEPGVWIATDFWPFSNNDFSGIISKITGVLSILPVTGSEYFYKSGAFRIKWWYFTFKLRCEFLIQRWFFCRAKLCLSLNWRTQSKGCVAILLIFPFSVMLIWILVNEDYSLLLASSIILHLRKLGTTANVLHLHHSLSTLFLL